MCVTNCLPGYILKNSCKTLFFNRETMLCNIIIDIYNLITKNYFIKIWWNYNKPLLAHNSDFHTSVSKMRGCLKGASKCF